VKCVSRYIRDEMVLLNKLPSDAGVLYVGIDHHPFLKNPASPRFNNAPLRLLYFGTLIHQKGVHTIIEALDILNKSGMSRSVVLTLIGAGRPDYVAQLRDQVERYGLDDSIHFVGHVSRDQIPMWLSKFDIFIFSSIYAEAMARTVMEAMAAGLMVIASPVGGQVEMLEEKLNCLMFSPGNSDELATQVTYAIQHPSESIRLAEAGRRLVLEKFTLDHVVINIEKWLENILIDAEIRHTGLS
jgi:colanic acid/amylovoran biosynthesis glycosyltransferase